MSETAEVFPLDPEKVYFSMDLLTLETEDGPKTFRLGSWLNVDPVRIHRMIVREKTLQVDQIEIYNPLMSKLRRADPTYYRKVMGLNVVIDFPGYSSDILAKIPFENDPVTFYKWWRKNPRKVTMNFNERVKLFLAVEKESPSALIKAHRAIINSGAKA